MFCVDINFRLSGANARSVVVRSHGKCMLRFLRKYPQLFIVAVPFDILTSV